MQHIKALHAAVDSVAPVAAVAWGSGKLAAVGADRVVSLYDDAGERRDKFKTKAAEGNAGGAYAVRGVAFSPDGSMLAVGQSDGMVFVYRLGAAWGDKKSICNKFAAGGVVSCLAWAAARPGEVVWGLANGAVCAGAVATNKATQLWAHPQGAGVVALAIAPDGGALVTSHADASVKRFVFLGASTAKLPPGPGQVVAAGDSVGVAWALAWVAGAVVACTSSGKVAFYDPSSGKLQQLLDMAATDPGVRDVTCGAASPTGAAVAFGAHDRLLVCMRSGQRGPWEAAPSRKVPGLGAVTALAWSPEGSCLAAGSLRGALDVWEAAAKQAASQQGDLEITQVADGAFAVKLLATGRTLVLKSSTGQALSQPRVFAGRYAAARTPGTLLLCDLQAGLTSELPWHQPPAASVGSRERLCFDNPGAVLLHQAGELQVVVYGQDAPAASVHCEHMSSFLVSALVRQGSDGTPAGGLLAYLSDARTIRVCELGGPDAGGGGAPVASFAHATRIDWLELSPAGGHLLFRDGRRQLHLASLAAGTAAPLLAACSYAQWVPGSSVVVAQSGASLAAWYDADHPRAVTMPASGQAQAVERRADGGAHVLCDDGQSLPLDARLIAFSVAMQQQDFAAATAALEAMPETADARALWAALGAAAVAAERPALAVRCYATAGDAARTRCLLKVLKQDGGAAGAAGPSLQARARLAALQGRWPVAEALLLAKGQVEGAIQLYREAGKWDDVVRVADSARAPAAAALKQQRLEWLLASGQQERAGQVREQEGDWRAAVALYLQAGAPARAAVALLAAGRAQQAGEEVMQGVLAALARAGLHERAGELLQHLGRSSDALAAYRRGHAYRRAVDLARTCAPADVVGLEEEWGDWLLAGRRGEAAVAHFVEAGATMKALEAAMSSHQLAKAAGILEHLAVEAALPHWRRLAGSYEEAGALAEAERCWVRAGAPMEAVDLYTRAGRWEQAQRVARAHLSEHQLGRLYGDRAREAEAARRWADAERCYLAAGQVEAAVGMYRRAGLWRELLALVAAHQRDQLQQMHLLVGQALAGEGRLREAERQLCDGKQWQAAVAMYRDRGDWQDALRLAKVYGGPDASKQVLLAWCAALGPSEAAALLRRLGLVDAGIEAAAEAGVWQQAFELAQAAAPDTVPALRMQHAAALEQEGRLPEAEAAYVEAGAPREAMHMYAHAGEWRAASRLAEAWDPAAVPAIQDAQVRALVAAGRHDDAEALLLSLRRPEAALSMYRSAGMWEDALRVATAHVPDLLLQVQRAARDAAAADAPAKARIGQASGSAGKGAALPPLEALLARAQALEAAADWAGAIDALLAASASDCPDMDALQQVWWQAVMLAQAHQRGRLPQVAAAAAQRLSDAGRLEAAAEVLQRVGDIPGAVGAYCAAGLFDRATGLTSGTPAMLAAIAQARQACGAAGAAQPAELSGGQADAEWAKAHTEAAAAGPGPAAALAASHAQQLMQRGGGTPAAAAAAAAVLAAHGVSPEQGHYEVYRSVVLALLGAPEEGRSHEGEAQLSTALYGLVGQMEGAAATALQLRLADLEDMLRLWQAAHLAAASQRAAAAGLRQLAARQLTAQLRSVGIVPADRAFFEAGMAWREAGDRTLAFLLLNRYLDLADELDEGPQGAGAGGGAASSHLDLGPFAGAGLLPAGFPMPARHYASHSRREEARAFVLEVSLEPGAAAARLPTLACGGCGAQRFEAALACPACRVEWEACVASGYPVDHPAARVVSTSGLPARRDAWNEWVLAFGTDPVTGAPAVPSY